MSAKILREKNIDELNQELASLLREQFNLRMQKGTMELAKPHLFQKVRKNIARVKTILSEKSQETEK